jgi:hypothetical protein
MTKVIVGGRQRGKTTRLLCIAHQMEEVAQVAAIVVQHHQDRQDLERRAQELGWRKPLVFTFEDIRRERHRGLLIHHVLIDDADRLLQSLFWTALVAAVTFDGTIETIGPVTVTGAKIDGSQ